MKHRKILSALLALVMMMALTVPALAAKTEAQISEEDGTFTINWVQTYDSEADDGNMTVFFATDGVGYDADGPLTVQMLDPNDLTFTSTGRTGEYEVQYYLWDKGEKADSSDSGYHYKGTVLLSKLNGSFANLAKADGIPAGASMKDLIWWVGDAEADLGYWMAAGTFHGFPKDFTVETTYNEPTEPENPAAGTYTVKKWDTWGQIALNNYGTYSRAVWTALKNANKGVALKEGAKIVLPEKVGKYTLLPAQVLAEGETLYTVKAGDTLGQIAVATYKDINMYKAIFERNADRLKNANSIYEGQVIVLPVKNAK